MMKRMKSRGEIQSIDIWNGCLWRCFNVNFDLTDFKLQKLFCLLSSEVLTDSSNNYTIFCGLTPLPDNLISCFEWEVSADLNSFDLCAPGRNLGGKSSACIICVSSSQRKLSYSFFLFVEPLQHEDQPKNTAAAFLFCVICVNLPPAGRRLLLVYYLV